MSKQHKTAIKPTRAESYPEWYQQVIKSADLAEVSPVRGCMTIKPWGYAIWENIKNELDTHLKATGHENIYFPLLIPSEFIEKEAQHIDGFAKECAVVTHTRLQRNEQGKLIPDGKLEKPYIIRPTSETIIGEAFARWIQSYRDLPLLINQWANVMRWEMRTRMFLRTSEFLWQEGHTAHSTPEEAQTETLTQLELYKNLAEDFMAMPVIYGEKSASERFPGAVNTYTIEAMMQDKKALQAGTSHYLGQSFAHAFNIKFLNKSSQEEFVYTTSWGVSTRLIGGLIMTHSDDDGLVLPPKVAPIHIIILPIVHKEQDQKNIYEYCEQIIAATKTISWQGRKVKIEIDKRDLRGGEKSWSWVKKGVPMRIEVGMRETDDCTVTAARRDLPYKNRTTLKLQEFLDTLTNTLDNIQKNIFNKAYKFQQKNTHQINNKQDFYDFFKGENNGGFALTHWNEDPKIEAKIKEDLAVTIRCIPMGEKKSGICPFSKEHSKQQVVFAKAY